MIDKRKSCDVILFGFNGDLIKRKILPSLFSLEQQKKILKNTRFICISRKNWTLKEYILIIRNSLKNFLNININKYFWSKFKKRFFFCCMDINKKNDFYKLKQIINKENNFLVNYLAVPYNVIINICYGLKYVNLNIFNTSIILEKPLGTSLKSFKKINNIIKQYFSEKQIFYIDHYLNKETVLNLLSLRFANPMFKHIWNHKIIDHIQITLAEDIGIKERWNYFDKIGQIKDMVQNHILQIISIIAMEDPISLDNYSICTEKIKVLKCLRVIDYTNIHDNIALGQYSNGLIYNKCVPAYVDENKNLKKSTTETFVAIRIFIDNKKWTGIPFYIRTGKRLSNKCSKIIIFFKNNKNNLFTKFISGEFNNSLTIRLQPNEGLTINFLNKYPNITSNYQLYPSELSFNYLNTFKNLVIPDAYERLLYECMQGFQSLFVHQEEIDLAWKWIDPIILACKKYPYLLERYPAGTWGTHSSVKMIQRNLRMWNNIV